MLHSLSRSPNVLTKHCADAMLPALALTFIPSALLTQLLSWSFIIDHWPPGGAGGGLLLGTTPGLGIAGGAVF